MKRLSLSILLIILAAAVLLISDLDQREQGNPHTSNIAILQYSSQIMLEEGVKGIIDGLKENGFWDGHNIHLRIYNSEGDLPTTNTIAKEITSGKFDYVLTVSTPALQAVANANKQGKAVQVFGLVTDPFSAGVGLDRAHPEIHSPHLIGYGTPQPVEKLIETALKLNPSLKTIGILWNTAEANSLVCTIQARNYTEAHGIQLLEANVENTSAVYEAASSLVSRGVDAILVSGDNTVYLGLDNVVAAANHGYIPVITNTPSSPNRGTLLDIGADYYIVGKHQAQMVARLLNGEDPTSIPIGNIAPEFTAVNMQVIKNLKGNWNIPDEILDSADIVIDESGNEIRKSKPADNKITNNKALTKNGIFIL